jgi:hypothetical protein
MVLSLNGVDPSFKNSITGSTCRAKCSNILHDNPIISWTNLFITCLFINFSFHPMVVLYQTVISSKNPFNRLNFINWSFHQMLIFTNQLFNKQIFLQVEVGFEPWNIEFWVDCSTTVLPPLNKWNSIFIFKVEKNQLNIRSSHKTFLVYVYSLSF